jgi:hypothetical protein
MWEIFRPCLCDARIVGDDGGAVGSSSASIALALFPICWLLKCASCLLAARGLTSQRLSRNKEREARQCRSRRQGRKRHDCEVTDAMARWLLNDTDAEDFEQGD